MTNGTRSGLVVSDTLRPPFTPGKDPVPIVQEAGWAPGPVWRGTGNLFPTGFRSPDHPARSQSLYRLRYPAHVSLEKSCLFIQGRCIYTEVPRTSHTTHFYYKSILQIDSPSWIEMRTAQQETRHNSIFLVGGCPIGNRSSREPFFSFLMLNIYVAVFQNTLWHVQEQAWMSMWKCEFYWRLLCGNPSFGINHLSDVNARWCCEQDNFATTTTEKKSMR